jgi:hypothetical protein
MEFSDCGRLITPILRQSFSASILARAGSSINLRISSTILRLSLVDFVAGVTAMGRQSKADVVIRSGTRSLDKTASKSE